MEIAVSVAATREPLLLHEAKEHIQVEHESDDAYIATLIKASRAVVENYTARALITRTLIVDFDADEAESPITLPLAPLGSVSSVAYFSTDGTSNSVAATDYYVVGTDPGRLVAQNSGWYRHRLYKSVRVTYTAGYGSSGTSVPDDLMHALKVVLFGLWNDPTAKDIPQAAKMLMDPYRRLFP